MFGFSQESGSMNKTNNNTTITAESLYFQISLFCRNSKNISIMSFLIETNFLISNIFIYFQKYCQMQFFGRFFPLD